MERRRRTFVTALATAGLSALAGCSGSDGGDETEAETATETGTGTATPAGTATETPTETEVEAETETETEPEEETEDEEGPETVEEAATLFIDDLGAGQFEAASERAAEDVRSDLSPGVLEQVWIGCTAVGGDYREVADTSTGVQSGFDAVDCRIAFERSEIVLRVLLGQDLNVWGVLFNGEYASPEYVDPGAFDEQELTLQTDACPLEATATVPDAEADVPGVVFVHGSGPADRDLTNGATKAFKDLAEGLATRGIASLRYDKRSFSCRRIPLEEQTIDNLTVDDAVTAVERLREVDGVDPDRIVVVGLSQGGMMVPRIAERDGGLAGIVGLSAPARPLYELLVDQYDHIASVGEYEREEIVEIHEELVGNLDRVRSGDYEPEEVIFNYPGAFWDSLADYDQVEAARNLDLPLLLCQGERDYQVTVEDDFAVWRDELAERGAASFERYDRLNHLLMPGEGPSVPDEYFPQNNVDPRVVEGLTAWIGNR